MVLSMSVAGNFKMSELAAAGILQWWDSFDIDSLQKQYLDNYYKELYALRDIDCCISASSR
jgi:hypothetical protein